MGPTRVNERQVTTSDGKTMWSLVVKNNHAINMHTCVKACDKYGGGTLAAIENEDQQDYLKAFKRDELLFIGASAVAASFFRRGERSGEVERAGTRPPGSRIRNGTGPLEESSLSVLASKICEGFWFYCRLLCH